MITLLKRRIRIRLTGAVRRDEGIAMAMVIGIAALLLILMATMASSAASGILKSGHDEDWNGAMAAAYAGVSDYQGRLANDQGYVRYGNPAAPFHDTVTGRRVVLPPTANPAFGIGVDGSWANVAGSTNRASFRYEVDNSDYYTTRVLHVRSTGRVGTTTRTIVADLTQSGFTTYLYFTDLEMRDPSTAGTAGQTGCAAQYSWQLTDPRPNSCLLDFIQGDIVNGQMHSNDTMVICGGEFAGSVTSANPTLVSGKRYSTSGCQSVVTPVFSTRQLTGPTYSKLIDMPPSNVKQEQEVRTDLPDTVPHPGCLYTGPTSITFNGAFMTVRSPWTKATQVVGSPNVGGTAPSQCGTPGNVAASQQDNAGTLAGANGVTIPVLDHNLIYVQGVQAALSNPNYWGPSFPNLMTSASYCVGAAGNADLGTGNQVGYPTTNETPPTANTYSCTAGDVFVKGKFDASMTIAAESTVFVTGDLVRQNNQTNFMGLVATSSVEVWNPMDSQSLPLLKDSGRQIDAAILSVAHSFWVQNYTVGGYRGALTVNGSIAQKYRGAVGQGNGSKVNGYSKKYVYDPRLRSTAPPKFLAPVTVNYAITVLVEVRSAFNSTGTGTS